jgi:predicted TIM-barrel fold metal-dependent hydrolase
VDVIVDGNVHLVASADVESGPAGTWRSDWPDGQALTAEAYEKAMAAAGVARAVLTTTVRRDGFDNSYTAAAAARDRHRFAYVGNFDVLAPGTHAVIEEQARRFAMAGARFYGGTADDAAAWLDDDRAAAAWGVAARLGLVVSAQRTRAGALGPLRAMAGKFPDVPVVVHSAADPALGADAGPSEADEVCALARWPNVLVMLASKNISVTGDASARGFLERLVGAFGPSRVMWGSYAQFAGARLPATAPSLGDLVANARKQLSFLSPEDLSWVLGRTAERTFWPVLTAAHQSGIERSS